MSEAQRKPGQPGNDLVTWARRAERKRLPAKSGPGYFHNLRFAKRSEPNRRPFSAEELAAIERFKR